MIGITVFSDTMIRIFYTETFFGNRFPHGQVKKAVLVSQIDNKVESTNRVDHMIW